MFAEDSLALPVTASDSLKSIRAFDKAERREGAAKWDTLHQPDE